MGRARHRDGDELVGDVLEVRRRRDDRSPLEWAVKVADPRKPSNWWGRNGIAHRFEALSTMRSACGRDFTHTGQDFTRFDPETGEPWPHCQRCERRSPQATDVASKKEE
jgi:hypothetical protein